MKFAVELLGEDGVWRPLAFRRGANGFAAFDVALPCYGVAVFKIRNRATSGR